jgi:hypothetical protein
LPYDFTAGHVWAGVPEEFQMTYPAACLSDDPVTIQEQMADMWRSWRAPRKPRPFWSISIKSQLTNEASELALLSPSLIAEAAPLGVFWHSHLPVWQMSGILAAFFAFTWWLTWTIVSVIRNGRG